MANELPRRYLSGVSPDILVVETLANVHALLASLDAGAGGQPDAEANLDAILNGVRRIVETARVDRPFQLAKRRDAITEISHNARFIRLLDDFPAKFAEFHQSMDKGADTSPLTDVLIEPAAPAELKPRSASSEPRRNRSSTIPEARAESVDRLLQSEQFWTPVLVCGFHHSGTRLMAQLLRAAGVFQRINTRSEEWQYVQTLNTLLLPGWMNLADIYGFDPDGISPLINAERIALRLAAAGYDGKSPWGHKDPRNSLTARAWINVFPGARLLHVVRHPLSAVGELPDSYDRFMPPDTGQNERVAFWGNLWSAYVANARAAMLVASRSTEVSFEELVANPVGVLREAVEALEIDCVVSQAVIEGVAILPEKADPSRLWINNTETEDAQVLLEGLALRYLRAPGSQVDPDT